jgi:hypothetical protein
MNKREPFYILAILILIGILWKGCQSKDEVVNLYRASTDSLHQVRNKAGQQVSTISILSGSIKDLKSIRASDSSSIGKLQKMVDDMTISATYLSTQTGNKFAAATEKILYVKGDTVVTRRDSIIYKNVYPEYPADYSNKWEKFHILAGKDSIHVEYKVFNEFDIKQEWQKPGLFSRKIPVATITNLNPHTETLDMRTFTLQENKGNRIRDVGMGAAGGALLIEVLRIFLFPKIH